MVCMLRLSYSTLYDFFWAEIVRWRVICSKYTGSCAQCELADASAESVSICNAKVDWASLFLCSSNLLTFFYQTDPEREKPRKQFRVGLIGSCSNSTLMSEPFEIMFFFPFNVNTLVLPQRCRTWEVEHLLHPWNGSSFGSRKICTNSILLEISSEFASGCMRTKASSKLQWCELA